MPSPTQHFQRHSTDDLVAARPDAAARDATRLPVVVVLDNIRSADNVGLIFRLCDCVNITELVLVGITAYPGVSRKADNRLQKTGVGGSLEVLPWRYVETATEVLAPLRELGWRVAAVEQGAGSLSWREADLATPLVLVFGHEREGVSDEALALTDVVIELPVRGITNSLNVALCASAVLYEVLGRALAPRPPG